MYIYSPKKKETQHVKKIEFTSNFQHHFKHRNKHYITLQFGTLVVQILKFIQMSKFITLMYNESFVNRTSLAPAVLFGINRCSVYTGQINKDFQRMDFI